MHIVLFRFSSLGDVVLTTSLPLALKARWGEKVFITFVTTSPFDQLLKDCPYIDQVVVFERKRGWTGLQKIRLGLKQIDSNQKIDLLIDMHGTLRTFWLRLTGMNWPRVSIDKRSLERLFLIYGKVDILSRQGLKRKISGTQIGELMLDRLLLDFGAIFDLDFNRDVPKYLDKVGVEFKPGQLSSCSATFLELPTRYLEELSLKFKKYIVIVPSASFIGKRWPVERFKLLIERFLNEKEFSEYQVVILAGKEDIFCQQFNEYKEKFSKRFFNFQGLTTLAQTTQILKGASLCIGNDTGVTHIAESIGVPCIGIFGPTGEQMGLYPHLPISKVVSKKMWCRPCLTSDKGFCIRSERYCLTLIEVPEVYNLAQKVLFEESSC